MNNETMTCRCCGKELPIEEFRMTRLGRMKTCKECVRQNQITAKLDKKLAKMQKKEVEDAKTKRLEDFTPRELMVALKNMGYNGKLTKVEIHEIDFKTL